MSADKVPEEYKPHYDEPFMGERQLAYFREKQYVEGRKLMCAKAQPNEYDEIWTFLYNNINFWSNGDPNIERSCVVALRNGMAKAPLCADPELNLAATLVELELAVEGA